MKKETKDLLEKITEVLDDLKAEDISVLDFSEVENSLADYFVICTATSNTHVNAIAGKLEKDVRKASKERPLHIEGYGTSEWVLLDYVNVIVHIFTPNVRDYYNIEALWKDIKRIDINKK